MFNFTVQYDEKKWLEMEEQIHNVYSNHPDPRSAEAAYSVSNIISDAFPNINKKEAMRNSQKIIKNFTGYELDTQNFMTEFVNTMKAQKSDLDVSMTFSKAMLEAQRSGVDSEAYKQKIHEAIEEMGSQKLPYRNDFKDMSLFTDLLVESGRIVPSMIPTMGMYIAGGALSTVTGGASLLAAKAGSSIYSGMMEAGSVAKDLFQVKDEEGNRLSDEYILSAWSLTMAGVGALNLVTDGFEKVTGGIANKVAGKIFSKQATKELVKSGAVKKWGQRIATDYLGKGITGEAAEEAIEELIGMASSNYIMKHSNETEGTLFEGHSKEDIIKAMAQTAVSTAKGMILTGLPSATISTIQEYNASDTALKRNANRFSEFNENSAAVSIDTIKVPSGVKETDVKKASEPIKVIQIGDLFKPLDEAHAGLVAGLKKKGAKALNVEVAETSSEFTKESVQSARSFARANEAVEKNGVVVFGDTETMQKKARDYALNQKSVVGYHENENEIIIDREEDGITHSLILRTDEGVKEAVQSKPVPSAPEPTETVLDESEETTQETEPEPTESELYEEEALLNEEEMSLDKQETVEPEQVVKKQYNHYNRTLQRKGAKPEEVEFLNKTILPQIHDTIKQQSPNMTEEEIYKLSIPSTYFAFVASKVAKTDVNTFFNENFNAQPFIALSMEQEADFLSSSEGIASTEVQIGKSAKPLLNGLTYKKGNKHQIGLAKGFTPTTVVHEMGHVLVNVIKDTEQFAPFLNVYASQLEQDGGSIGTHFQEAFAKDLEQYFIDGKVRDSSLGTIFKEIGQAIRDFLGLISPQLDRETRIAFDRLFDFKLEQESKAEQETTVEATKAPQLQLDLFGEPNEVVDTLAKISNRGYWHLEELISNYNGSLEKSGVDYDWDNQKTIAPHWFWFNRLKYKRNADGKIFKLNDGEVRMSSRNINHIIREHGKDGVNIFHVSRIAQELANPVMVIKSPSNNDINKDGPLFVTRYYVEHRGEMQPLLIAVRNYFDYPDGKDGIAVDNGITVNSMYPWKPEMNGGKSLDEYALEGNILAINSRAFGKESREHIGNVKSDILEERIKTRPVENAHTLLRSVPDITTLASEQKILDIKPFVNKQNMEDVFDNRIPTPENPVYIDLATKESDQVLASIRRDVEIYSEEMSRIGALDEDYAKTYNIEESSYEFGTTNPKAKKRNIDPVKEKSSINMDYVMKHRKTAKGIDIVQKMADVIDGYEWFNKGRLRNPEKIVQKFKDFAKDNLRALYDMVDEEVREQTRRWYIGANRIARRWSIEYGRPIESISAAIANLSPQKDWFQNVSLAQRLMDIVSNIDSIEWDDSMSEAVRIGNPDAIAVYLPQVDKSGNTSYENYNITKYISGKSLKQLVAELESEVYTDEQIQEVSLSKTKTTKDEETNKKIKIYALRAERQKRVAAWIRLYDETHNPKSYNFVGMDGTFGDTVKDQNGEEKKVAWGSFSEIASSFIAFTNSDPETLSSSLGTGHKVRNFYNNILIPMSKRGYVTIDTHAVAASLMMPVAGTSYEVKHNFGTGEKGMINPSSNGADGIYGTYPIYAQAYIEVAEELGLLPRELQSITWEAIRKLFTEDYKNESTLKNAREKWKSYFENGGDNDETRQQIIQDANEKMGRGRTVREQINAGYGVSTDAVVRESSYERTLPLKLIRDQQRRRSGSGDRIGTPLGLSEPRDERALGGNGRADNQGFAGVRTDLEDETLASISRDVDLDTTKRSLENHYYVPDSTLKALEGDPDVDWEIQFRRIMLQDPTIFKTFQRALKTVENELDGEQEVTAEAVLKVLEENHSEETFTAMKDEVRDPERFVERLIWQSRFEGATKADRNFSKKLTDKEYLLEVVRTLLKNSDMGSIHNDLPSEFYSLDYAFANKKDTEYRYKEARKAIRNDLRRYRRDFYKHKGMLPQLSYEKTVEGTYLDEGVEVEAFGNEELRKLLEAKDTDPVVKEMIRKNLATGDVVETLVNTTREQISQLEADLMGTEAELQETSDALVNKTGELEAVERNVGKLEDKYHNLQKINKKNSERKRMYKRLNALKKKRIEAMKIKQTLDRANRTIKNIASSKSNTNDAKIMDRLNKTLEILYASSGEELSAEFEARKIGIQDIPSQLMPFFEFVDDGVYAQNPAKGMDIRTVVALRNAASDVRSEAKYEKTMRDEALKRETFKIANEYLATNNNKSFENIEEFREFMAKEKLKGSTDKEGNKALSFFERNFITMNRLIDKLDPAQKTLKPFIFGGIDGNGVFHRGIEGVLDDEKREEYNRYQAAKKVMKELEIDKDSLLKKHVTLKLDTKTGKKGKEETVTRDFTLEEAIGIYIYSKQPDALEKLTSPDGNKLVIERDEDGNIIRDDVETVVNSLTDKQKQFGDWLMNDMGSRYNEVADVYYKINNKSLEKIANYFPLIRTGEHISFSDLMEDQYLNMQETPEDSMTRKRTGGDYPLQLNALSIWNKMVSKQEHYIAGAEFFHKTNWLMHKNGGDMYNLIAMNAGKDYATALQDFLNRVANKRYIYDDADTMINRVRANMVVARLGFNILTTLKQLPAFGLFAQQFGVGRLFEAIAHMSSDYKGTSEFIYDKSPQMRGHSMSIDFSSFTQMETKTEFGRKVKKIGEVGMTPIQFIDGFIKKTLWYGAYQNNIANGMTDEQASMEATKWINDTQPGGTTKDSAAIYDTNSTIVKYLLMFTNQLNKNMNIVYDIPYAIKNKMYEKAFKNMVGLGISLAGIVALEGGFDDEDDDDKMWDDLLRNFSSQFISMFPVIGPDVSDIVMDRYYSDSGMPLVSEVYSFTKAIGSGDRDRIIDRSVSLGLGGAEFVGLPSGQTKKIWDAFTEDGKVNLWYLLGRDFVE